MSTICHPQHVLPERFACRNLPQVPHFFSRFAAKKPALGKGQQNSVLVINHRLFLIRRHQMPFRTVSRHRTPPRNVKRSFRRWHAEPRRMDVPNNISAVLPLLPEHMHWLKNR